MKFLAMIAAAVALMSYLMCGVSLLMNEPLLGGTISDWVGFATSFLMLAVFFILFDYFYLQNGHSKKDPKTY